MLLKLFLSLKDSIMTVFTSVYDPIDRYKENLMNENQEFLKSR